MLWQDVTEDIGSCNILLQPSPSARALLCLAAKYLMSRLLSSLWHSERSSGTTDNFCKLRYMKRHM